jgi:hypothetical protein
MTTSRSSDRLARGFVGCSARGKCLGGMGEQQQPYIFLFNPRPHFPTIFGAVLRARSQ